MVQEVPSSRPGERTWASALGHLVIRELTSEVTLFIEKGFLDAEFTPLVVAGLEATLQRSGHPRLFVDAEALEGCAPELLREATAWLHRHRARVGVQHMLVRSRLAQTGLSLASVKVGSAVKGYNLREPFEAALAAALRGEPAP